MTAEACDLCGDVSGDGIDCPECRAVRADRNQRSVHEEEIYLRCRETRSIDDGIFEGRDEARAAAWEALADEDVDGDGDDDQDAASRPQNEEAGRMAKTRCLRAEGAGTVGCIHPAGHMRRHKVRPNAQAVFEGRAEAGPPASILARRKGGADAARPRPLTPRLAGPPATPAATDEGDGPAKLPEAIRRINRPVQTPVAGPVRMPTPDGAGEAPGAVTLAFCDFVGRVAEAVPQVDFSFRWRRQEQALDLHARLHFAETFEAARDA